MQEQIKKLKNERDKLTREFQNSRTEYKTEVKRIDRAIRSFEKGMGELNGTPNKTKRYNSPSVIEEILAEFGQLHLKQLCEKLHERSIPMQYQSLSGLMQMYAKAGKKFVKTAPATFGLIAAKPEELTDFKEEIAMKIENTTTEAETTKKKEKTAKKQIVEKTVEETENAPDRTIIYDEETNTIVSEGEV